MKKLLTLCAILVFVETFAQVSFSIIEPASIAGGYDFTSNGDGPGWGLPNLLDPADAVMDTVIIADDGTPGLNAQGIPFANECCSPVINDLTGKIAMVYRYDGVSTIDCYGGTRIMNAQNAGAVGVIFVNRDDNLYGYSGTVDGAGVMIPFAFITKTDGAIIRAKVEAGEDVVAFIGNKLGLYGDDIGVTKPTSLIPSSVARPALLSLDDTEFSFDAGTKIYNYGTNTQSDITLTATVNGPGVSWTQSSGPHSVASGDSIDIYTGGVNDIPAFSNATYPTGKYTLTYSATIGALDEAAYDNSVSFNFFISDTIFTYGNIDTITLLPKAISYYRPSGSGSFSMCSVLDDANGSRLGAAGIFFSAATGYGSGVSLDGELFELQLYNWDDAFTDLNDAALDMIDLNPIAEAEYIFLSDLQSEVVYAPFDAPVQLEDNQRHLACVTNYNTDVYLGYDTRTNYTRNVSHYLQPLFPVLTDGSYFVLGFGEDLAPSMSLRVFDANELSAEENGGTKLEYFPNPASDVLNISGAEMLSVTVVSIAGQEIAKTSVTGLSAKLDVSDLASGTYLADVQFADGSSEKIRFVIK